MRAEGQQLQARRKALGLSKSALADRAGKVREVIYRWEAGEESTVSSLLFWAFPSQRTELATIPP